MPAQPAAPAAPAELPVMSLRERIAAALTKPTKSDTVSECLFDTQRDIARVELDIEAAKRRAFDPLATEAEAAVGKRAAESLGFDRERLVESEARLKERLRLVRAEEGQAGLRERYDEAAAARDAILSEVTERYPKLAAELLDLVDRMTAAERLIQAANAHLPDDRARLQHVEYALRKPGTGPQVATFASAVQLPKLIRMEGDCYLKVSHPSWELQL